MSVFRILPAFPDSCSALVHIYTVTGRSADPLFLALYTQCTNLSPTLLSTVLCPHLCLLSRYGSVLYTHLTQPVSNTELGAVVQGASHRRSVGWTGGGRWRFSYKNRKHDQPSEITNPGRPHSFVKVPAPERGFLRTAVPQRIACKRCLSREKKSLQNKSCCCSKQIYTVYREARWFYKLTADYNLIFAGWSTVIS